MFLRCFFYFCICIFMCFWFYFFETGQQIKTKISEKNDPYL